MFGVQSPVKTQEVVPDIKKHRPPATTRQRCLEADPWWYVPVSATAGKTTRLPTTVVSLAQNLLRPAQQWLRLSSRMVDALQGLYSVTPNLRGNHYGFAQHCKSPSGLLDSAFKPLKELQMIHRWSALEEECTPQNGSPEMKTNTLSQTSFDKSDQGKEMKQAMR